MQNKLFRCKMQIREVSNEHVCWFFFSCDTCSSKASEDDVDYRCTNPNCSSKSASPRYKLMVAGADKNASIELVFFGDTARDLIGKQEDVLLAESYASQLDVPSEISALVGRNYVVDVTLSRYCLRQENISFQVMSCVILKKVLSSMNSREQMHRQFRLP